MDELHKAISNRDLDTVKNKTAVFDSGATSNCGVVGDDFILTEEKYHKIFNISTGTTAPASVKEKLHHSVRDPTRTVDMVLDLKHNSLMSY